MLVDSKYSHWPGCRHFPARFLGVASAYLGGKFDLGVQRVLEVLQAFPDLILALLLMVALGPGLGTVILAIAVTRIPFGGRVVRSVALQVRSWTT